MKKEQIYQRKITIFHRGGKKTFLSKNDGKQARKHPNHIPLLVLPLAWHSCVCVFNIYEKHWEFHIVILIQI